MAGRKHFHRLQRSQTTGGKHVIYKCRDNCSSYFYLDDVVGRTVTCWACRRPFIFAKKNLRQANVRCPNCPDPRGHKEKAAKASDDLLSRLGLETVAETKEIPSFTVGEIEEEE